MKGFVASLDLDGRMIIKSAPRPSLELLKEAIGGGLIETVPYFTSFMPPDQPGKVVNCIAFVDEEGKLKGFQVNQLANQLWHEAQARRGHAPIHDFLVGKLCIVWGDAAWMREL